MPRLRPLVLLVGLVATARAASLFCLDQCALAPASASAAAFRDAVIEAELEEKGVLNIRLGQIRLKLQNVSIDFGNSSSADTSGLQPASDAGSSTWIIRVSRASAVSSDASAQQPPRALPPGQIPSHGWGPSRGSPAQHRFPPWWANSWWTSSWWSTPYFAPHSSPQISPGLPANGGLVQSRPAQGVRRSVPYTPGLSPYPREGQHSGHPLQFSNIWGYPLRLYALPEAPWTGHPWWPGFAPSGVPRERYPSFGKPTPGVTPPNPEQSTPSEFSNVQLQGEDEAPTSTPSTATMEPTETLDSMIPEEEATEVPKEETTLPAATAQPTECSMASAPEGYVRLPGQRSAYKVHVHPRIWIEASKACRGEGGYLAVPDSQREAAELWELWRNESERRGSGGATLFVGLHDLDVEGDWQTVHGDWVSHMDHISWANGRPDGGDYENCGILLQDLTYDDAACNYPLPFICECCD